MYLGSSEDASVAGGSREIKIMWVPGTSVMTLAFTNKWNYCGFWQTRNVI